MNKHRLPPSSVSYLRLGVVVLVVGAVVTVGATRLVMDGSLTATGPLLMLLLLIRSRSERASPISVSLSEVSLHRSGEVSGVVCVELGEAAAVYGKPKAGFILPVRGSGDTDGVGGGGGKPVS